jgi:arabinose-5-phosphate isomerase
MVKLDTRDLQQAAVASAISTLKLEQEAVASLAAALESPPLSQAFAEAVALIAATRGRLIVSGMGKSGLIGRKIAATMTSTGTPAFFLHPSEASHGDLGMITPDDVLLLISWSGETFELQDIITFGRNWSVPRIVITSNPNSSAARAADICLTLPRVREACPNQLAPTSSTTIQGVLGDALAVALIEARGFSTADFHEFHPRGQLGAQLISVRQLMGTGDAIPMVTEDRSLLDATIEMSRKRYGCTAVVNGQGNLVGAFTDGDLRRSFAANAVDDSISKHMTPQPLFVSGEMRASDALRLMNENAVSVLFVCEGNRLTGLVHMHDILRLGFS